LASNQGGFCRRAHPFELGHAEKFQQAEMHKNSDCCGEPPSTKKHDDQAKNANSTTAEHPFA
jgi:hypothetical protein